MSSLYRAMKADAQGCPVCEPSARGLGLRVPVDIALGPDALCRPASGGLSVAPDSPLHLPQHRRPVQLGGTGRDPVFSTEAEALPLTLAYRPDPRAASQHGFIEPARPVSLEALQRDLCQTASLWRPWQ